MTAVSDETGRDWLPLKYEDGPDFCTVTFATGAAFALTVHPERMKLMEAALSAAPVGEPALRMCGYCKTWNSKPCGEQCYLQPSDPVWTAPVAQEPVAWVEFTEAGLIRFWTSDPARAEAERTRRSLTKFTLSELIALVGRPRTPPATPAGTPANRGDRVIYWLKRYQADEHLDDDACEELDALINVLSKGVKVQPSAGVGADEIARAVCDGMSNGNIQLDEAGPTLRADCFETATAILALLSRAGDQSNSTHEA